MKRYFAILFFVLAGCVPAIALTLSDIRTQVRIAIRDNPADTSRYRYSNATLLQFINEGQREVNNLTWACDTSQTYVLTPLTTYYALPTDLIAVHQAYFKDKTGNLIELEEYLQKTLYDQFPSWDKSNGSPVYYWVSSSSGTSITASNPLQISYIPIPTRQSTGTVTIWYYNQPSDLASDSDIPFDGQAQLLSYNMAIAYHAISRIKSIEARNDEAGTYQAMYQTAIAIMKDRIGRAPNVTSGVRAGGK